MSSSSRPRCDWQDGYCSATGSIAPAAYAIAEGPDGLLIEIFQPDPNAIAAKLRSYFDNHPTGTD